MSKEFFKLIFFTDITLYIYIKKKTKFLGHIISKLLFWYFVVEFLTFMVISNIAISVNLTIFFGDQLVENCHHQIRH
jgi:hypothetical protein